MKYSTELRETGIAFTSKDNIKEGHQTSDNEMSPGKGRTEPMRVFVCLYLPSPVSYQWDFAFAFQPVQQISSEQTGDIGPHPGVTGYVRILKLAIVQP